MYVDFLLRQISAAILLLTSLVNSNLCLIFSRQSGYIIVYSEVVENFLQMQTRRLVGGQFKAAAMVVAAGVWGQVKFFNSPLIKTFTVHKKYEKRRETTTLRRFRISYLYNIIPFHTREYYHCYHNYRIWHDNKKYYKLYLLLSSRFVGKDPASQPAHAKQYYSVQLMYVVCAHTIVSLTGKLCFTQRNVWLYMWNLLYNKELFDYRSYFLAFCILCATIIVNKQEWIIPAIRDDITMRDFKWIAAKPIINNNNTYEKSTEKIKTYLNLYEHGHFFCLYIVVSSDLCFEAFATYFVEFQQKSP